ncbi:DUF2933 domain-containing protein [Imbroritus primus]|uniref:DUF2933 domain-containing protein n=1 Tax=Imbroritus primus TaxID=3058603 RepID=A0ACD3SSR3_9BURK|nr:DUF2933 domain-containing protein [Burkholderiaceae bacterium PBA]
MNSSRHPDEPHVSPRRPLMLAWATLLLIAVFYLLREHWGHVLGWWPYLLLMLCPLMHLCHGHRGHGSSHEHPQRKDEP